MAQKRKFYVKTSSGAEEQHIITSAEAVELKPIDGLDAENAQEAIEQLVSIANSGGVTGVKGEAETEYRQGQVNISKQNIGLGNVTNDAQVKRSEMGANGGVATLDDSGKVPASQLPSYVDDTLEGYYNTVTKQFYSDAGFTKAITGESGKIYVDLNTNKTYRWSGSAFVEISASLALGETDSTAYVGSKGKKNAEDIKTLQDEMDAVEEDVADLKDGTTKAKKAETADKLANARKISFSGDVTGETTFDGSADKSIPTTLANSGVAPGTYSVTTVDAKGRVTAGAQLVEWGTSGQTSPSSNLAVGGLFFALTE